jgi:hypothetical protein
MPVEIWTDPIVRPSLVALTRAEICLVSGTHAGKVGEIREKLEGAKDPSKVLGWRDTVIPLSAILSVRLDKTRGEMLIHHAVRNKEGKKGTEVGFIKFKEPKAADDFLRTLHARLGPGWRTRTKQYGRLRASLKPLAAMLIVLVGYLVGFGAGNPFAFVWTLVPFVLFVLVLTACFVWLILYLLKPPLMAFLEARGPG